jgi:hypothetical protein
MTRLYRLFGITVASPLALPTPVVRTDAAPDVVLRHGSRTRFARLPGDWPRSTKQPAWFLFRTLPDGTAYLRWTGLYEFLIAPGGRCIWYHRFDGTSPDSFHTQLLGQVLSFSLLAFGHEPLHATVIARRARAVALFGECGDGKSTLAASLLARGCSLVTDDVMVTERRANTWLVHPGVPRIKLFPDVARRLLGRVDGTPMNSGTSKLVVPLETGQAASAPVALRSIYVLPASGSAQVTGRRPRAEPLGGREAFLEIVRAAFNLQIVTRDRQSNQFAFATRLARDVPIHRLTYKRSFTALPAVADLLLSDLT